MKDTYLAFLQKLTTEVPIVRADIRKIKHKFA